MKTAIKTRAIDAIAFALFANEDRKDRKQQKKYDKMIAKSQAKIGPYVHHNCPVQIWA